MQLIIQRKSEEKETKTTDYCLPEPLAMMSKNTLFIYSNGKKFNIEVGDNDTPIASQINFASANGASIFISSAGNINIIAPDENSFFRISDFIKNFNVK